MLQCLPMMRCPSLRHEVRLMEEVANHLIVQRRVHSEKVIHATMNKCVVLHKTDGSLSNYLYRLLNPCDLELLSMFVLSLEFYIVFQKK